MADVIHKPTPHSIYERTDYIAVLNMAIPRALARTWQTGIVTESGRHPGFPPNDRRPQLSPLVLAPGHLPIARK